MLNLDSDSEYGQRVRHRLRDEQVVWLTTVDRTGTPRSVPVWFLWDGEVVLIYTPPDTLKVRNIERHPRVNLHFDGDARGGDIVVLTGKARVAPDAPAVSSNPPYIEKYGAGIERIGMTPTSFSARYSTPILVTPERVSGH
jgi:PPOX class probable F420-dependent enzyme